MLWSHTVAAVRAAEARVVDAAPQDAFMRRAARAVADAAARLSGGGDAVLALVGGGDNGGDALYAAAYLARAGRRVRAALLSAHPHPRGLEAARDAGVEFARPHLGESDAAGFAREPVWLDGITGSGLRGALREPLAGLVAGLDRRARRSGALVVSIDIPSGLSGDDGRTPGPVLAGDHLVTMGAVKRACLLPPAALAVGDIEVVDMGLAFEDAGGEPAPLGRFEAPDAAARLRAPGRADHKYSRGVVGVCAGSATYPGAGVLAAEGALAAGPGMVRLLSAPEVARLVLARHPGVVTAPGRVQAQLVGSGLDADMERRARDAAAQALERGLPLVVDAGGLRLLPELLGGRPAASPLVLTPHAGEAAALLARLVGEPVTRPDVEADPAARAAQIARSTGAWVVLKGSVTLVVGRDGPVYSLAGAPGWTGVAGSGDVLGGIVASLLAGRQADAEGGGDPLDVPGACAAGVWLHSRAAGLASGCDGRRPGGPIQPEDIARRVPAVIASLLAGA